MNAPFFHRVVDWSVEHTRLILIAVLLACAGGWWAMLHTPLDALPDLSQKQVIVFSRWDRSADLVEDQVTRPIVAAMLGAPHVKDVRGISDFGYSYVYVIFDDATDLYWARARIAEALATLTGRLPSEVRTELGPDATSLGWVFQYALIDKSGRHNLAELRSYQDWYLRRALSGVPGVAEVATAGGPVKEYQVRVDPRRLDGYGIPMSSVVQAVRDGNQEASGRWLELGGSEYMVRGRGYARQVSDFEQMPVGLTAARLPVLVKDVAQVGVGPAARRGVTDLDGEGEAVSGIVVMRSGENALEVIDRVKARLEELKPSLPAGVEIEPIYDRSTLIRAAIHNTRNTMIEILATVAVVVLLFLWHFPSAVIPIITIPAAVLITFLPFRMLGVSINLLSMAGLAIAFGELIDASIVVVEQTHKKLELWQRSGEREPMRQVVLGAIKEVSGPTFFALLIMAVSFLPVLALEAEEGKMFRPLALAKTVSMVVAALLALTLDPALRMLLTRSEPFHGRFDWLNRAGNRMLIGRVQREESHPLSRMLRRSYEPVVDWTLRHKWVVLGVALAIGLITIPTAMNLGTEFMPPLDEGTILYMPSTMPGISLTEAQRILEITDRVLKEFPEVDRVLGKAGRAETATDPAPLSMLETTVVLRPQAAWRSVDTSLTDLLPAAAPTWLRTLTQRRMTKDELVDQLDRALDIPGLVNGWTMPIKGRNEMQTTGFKSAVGIRISGADPKVIERLGTEIESQLKEVPGTRGSFAERVNQGNYLDLAWRRDRLAAYGLSIAEVQGALQSAVGGDVVTTVVDGAERYGVSVRYLSDFRSDLDALRRLAISVDGKRRVTVGDVAEVQITAGPSMLREDNGQLTGYVYIDLAGRDAESYVAEAKTLLRSRIALPPGYELIWSGSYQAIERVRERMRVVVPLTVAMVILLLYWNTRSAVKTLIVLLAVPFSAVGAVWYLSLAGYHMSTGVWVGIVALIGVDAGTGVFMLMYLDLAYREAERAGRLNTLEDLRTAIRQGSATRIRPKFMTFATTCLGLLPILWGTGVGSDLMKRIAAPLAGGIFTSFLLELILYPAIYEIWRWHTVVKFRSGSWHKQPELVSMAGAGEGVSYEA